MTDNQQEEKDELETEMRKMECPHCKDFHEVEVVVEPGYERIVFCPKTGDAG